MPAHLISIIKMRQALWYPNCPWLRKY